MVVEKMFLDYFKIPVFKENINLVFVKKGPYYAIKELELLEKFANSFHNGNIGDAADYLKESNAMVVRLDEATFIILPFNVTPGVIAHEIFHLCVMVLEKRGVRFSDSSEEAYAHLIDWLTDKIYSYHKIMLKKTAKKKKK